MSAEAAEGDLNAVITNAVQARVEASVLAALSGSDVFSKFVKTALGREIEVSDGRNSYKTRKTTFLEETIAQTIRAATEEAVKRFVDEETSVIEEAVRKALRKDVATIAANITSGFTEATKNDYRMNIEIHYPDRRR